MARLLWTAALALLVTLGFAPARAETPIKIGVVKLTGSIPIYIALDEGFFKAEGLDASLVWFDASAPVATATVSGDVDFGSAAFTGALFNLGAKGGLVMVASQLRDAPGFHLNALMATTAAYDKGFKTVRDLPGKRIGMTTVGSTMHYTVALLSKKYGFDLSQVTMVPLQSLQNLNAAFAGGQIDGGIIGAAAANKFASDGTGRIIAWTGDEAPWQLGAQITRPAMVRDHKDEVAAFVRAYRKGIDAYYAAVKMAPDGKVAKGTGYDQVTAIVGKYLGLAPAQVEAIFPSFDPTAALDIADIKNQVAFYKAQGLVDQSADVDKMVDTEFLAAH